ncbi:MULTISPECIES: hypothetical protein [unclassified Streptomyces]|uniref:hypothetical protein n=1 Tax=unclassified Streptomyces TaxID=2593676 RepID=UPI00039E1B18|nr:MULTISPECIES: hypothetical protein [unclassified Streptomyces]MYT33365.1 hypothetical protein [Streptomyces sp. SID8354]
MSSMFSRRGRALRVAATSAAVAAAVLGPASGAFAAQTGADGGTPAAVGTDATAAPAKTAPAPVKPAAKLPASDRYAGQPVYIGKGYVAVLRNDPAAGGPEAWIRYVGPQWKPGDTYIVRVIDLLDRGHRTASLDGMTLRLLGADGSAPKLQVTGPQGTKTYALPRSAEPGGGKSGGAKPAGAQHTGHRKDCMATTAPQGCSIPVGKVTGTGAKPATATAGTATATAATVSDVKATVSDVKATGGQTKVVPNGSVAAGAEGVGDSGHTLVLAGGAFASAGAAGIAIAVLRRRQDAGSQG